MVSEYRMGFIERELQRIKRARTDPGGPLDGPLEAAQQALAWAIDPTAFMSPACMLLGSETVGEDCSLERRPRPSEAILSRCGS